MRLTTPLLGAAIGGAVGLAKNDPWKYIVWGGGLGLLVTILGGASAGVGGISLRVGAAPGHAGSRGPMGPRGRMGERGLPGLPNLPGYGGYDGNGPYAYGDYGMGGYAGDGGPYEGGVDWGYDF